MHYYRQIIKDAVDWLRPGGYLVIETGEAQANCDYKTYAKRRTLRGNRNNQRPARKRTYNFCEKKIIKSIVVEYLHFKRSKVFRR